MKLLPYIIVFMIISGLLYMYQTTPYMSLNEGLDTVYIGNTYRDPGATIKIGNDHYEMLPTHQVDTTQLGKQVLTYTYTYNDRLYSISRHIMIIEYDLFSMSLNAGIDTISIGERWTDAGVTTTHDVEVEVISSVNRLRTGTYEVIYRVTYMDDIYELTRYVTVVS